MMTKIKKSVSKRKLMHYRTDIAGVWISLTLVLLLFFLGGCARVPWSTIIEGDPRNQLEQNYRQLGANRLQCPTAWDAEVAIRWSNQLQTRSFAAYAQFLYPSYLKLVISNPLGQPLKLMVTDGSSFHLLDAVQKASTTGNLRSFAMRNDLPWSVIDRSWIDWMTGQPTYENGQITHIRNDREARGVWLTIAMSSEADGNPNELLEHVLFDHVNQRIYERIVIDQQQRPMATIRYRKWQEFDGCPRPIDLSISGLNFGTSVDFVFSDIRAGDFLPETFRLPIPQGYSRTLMP